MEIENDYVHSIIRWLFKNDDSAIKCFLGIAVLMARA